MPRASTVDKLPPAIRERIGKLLDEHVTLDEILDALKDLGAEQISRSALGRYAKRMRVIGDRMRRARELSNGLMQRLGDAPESKMTALNIELMQSIILGLVGGAEDDQDAVLEPKDAMFLSQSLKSLADARQKDANYILQIRRQVAAEQNARVDRAAQEIGASAKEAGLSAERIIELQQKVAGLRIEAPKAAT